MIMLKVIAVLINVASIMMLTALLEPEGNVISKSAILCLLYHRCKMLCFPSCNFTFDHLLSIFSLCRQFTCVVQVAKCKNLL